MAKAKNLVIYMVACLYQTITNITRSIFYFKFLKETHYSRESLDITVLYHRSNIGYFAISVSFNLGT